MDARLVAAVELKRSEIISREERSILKIYVGSTRDISLPALLLFKPQKMRKHYPFIPSLRMLYVWMTTRLLLCYH